MSAARAAALCALALATLARAADAPPAKRPNLLVIVTDQQQAGMLSCAGNPYVKTPNLDGLARAGVRFERAYCGNPVCVPSRFCMLSGRLPSMIGMETNGEIGNEVSEAVFSTAMGAALRRAGYQTVYGGKTHVPGGKKGGAIGRYGFDAISEDARGELAEACAAFLRGKHEKPFLLVASFINPHDICYMAIRAWKESGKVPKGAKVTPLGKDAIVCLDAALRRPEGLSEEAFFRDACPPLPANSGIPAGELSVFGDMLGGFRGYVREAWTERDWRLHRWAYARLTERVDAEIGKVLAALREAGLEENTVVVFTSDHGDMDGAHRFEHKSLLYEEAVRVPLIVSWKGVTQAGAVDRSHLVSTGLDLIPTLCDFAGAPVPEGLKGLSVRPLAEGRAAGTWRETLVVENVRSRLLLCERWKYMVGAVGAVREMVVDLDSDPGELRNLALEPAGRERVERGRKLLKAWYAGQGVPLDAKYAVEAQGQEN